MATPVCSRPRDKRYLGNSSSRKEVHDLRNEDTGGGDCQIREIVVDGHAVVFSPDVLTQARSEGYDPCAKCLNGSQR